MPDSFKDAAAFVTIAGNEYALFRKGPLKNYPYMIDISSGQIPEGEQRPLLRDYLLLHGVDIEPWNEKDTHWCIRKAIQISENTALPLSPLAMSSNAVHVPVKISPKRSSKEYLPLTEENILLIHQQVLNSPDYGTNTTKIHDVLTRFPQNIDPELVAMKIALIDLTNSTHLNTHMRKITLTQLVDLILSISDFDTRLAQGDPELVNQLANANGNVNLFSFASKYCTYHNVEVYEKDDYSIFDSIVKKALPHYVSGLTQAKVEVWRKTFNYAAFNGCIDNLLNVHNISISFRRRKFDHFLWYTNRK